MASITFRFLYSSLKRFVVQDGGGALEESVDVAAPLGKSGPLRKSFMCASSEVQTLVTINWFGCSMQRCTRAETQPGCWRMTSRPLSMPCPSASSLPGAAVKSAISVIKTNYLQTVFLYLYRIIQGSRRYGK